MTDSASRVFVSGNDRSPITDDRLTIADITRHLEPLSMNRSTIQRYDGNTDLQEALGKQDGRYPASSLPFWEAIARARSQDPPLVRPETAAIFVKALIDRLSVTDDRSSITDYRLPITGQRTESEALVMARDMGGEAVGLLRELATSARALGGSAERLDRLIDALERQTEALERQPVQEDYLLDAPEAGKLLGCKPASVRRYVAPVRRGRWRRSDILRYIQNLQPIR